MANLIELIKAVRNIRAEANAPMSSTIDVLIKTANTDLEAVFENNREYIDRFVHPKELTIGADVAAPTLAMSAIITDAEVYVPLAELVDLNEEAARLEKEVKKFESEVDRAKKKLANERFVANAPDDVVDAERQKQSENESKLQATKDRLAAIKAQQ